MVILFNKGLGLIPAGFLRSVSVLSWLLAMPCHTSALTAVASLTGEGTIGSYRTALVKVSGLTHRQNAPDTHCMTGLGVV